MSISYKDVTFIIQGAVAFSGSENITSKCIDSIRFFYPDASIIISTWKNNYYQSGDNVLINSDPGKIETSNKYFINYNRMLVSTRNGINYANTKFVAKVRSDFWFEKYYPVLEKYYEVSHETPLLVSGLMGRIMMCMYKNHYSLFPFNISDWFQFGHKEDMAKLWGSDLVSCKDKLEIQPRSFNILRLPFYYCDVVSMMDYPYHSEQQLCVGFMKSLGKSPPTDGRCLGFIDLVKSYIFLGKIFFVESRDSLGLKSCKHNITKSKNDTKVWDLAVKSSFSKISFLYLIASLIRDYINIQYILFKIFIRKKIK